MNSVSSNVEIRHQKNGVKKCEAFIGTNKKTLAYEINFRSEAFNSKSCLALHKILSQASLNYFLQFGFRLFCCSGTKKILAIFLEP